MLSSFLTYRGGARHHAGRSGSAPAERGDGDAVITAPAGEKKPNISTLRALSFMLTGHIRRVEQGSAAGAIARAARDSAGGHLQRAEEGRAASKAPRAELDGPTESAAFRPLPPRGRPQETFVITLHWMFPRAGTLASPAPARRVDAGDVPPPLPPKQRNRAGVSFLPGRATLSTAARASGTA
ncbi:MAG: hypothetical protein ACMX3H_09935 [Sodalis sp. (in: enterobacteria)]|uniref:hypothetical protein n=1 Tax=Sodalis sp. (in: enterobacteria) TaxID=1898979 RepID=UPI0039E25F00